MLEEGYDIWTIRELLGHKDLKTTMIYAHVLSQPEAAVFAVPPTLSNAASLLLAGELGCRFRPLTSLALEASFPAQRLARVEDAMAQSGFFAGELGCDFRSLRSPHSVP